MANNIRLKVYRDAEDGAWIADISEGVELGNEWSGSYWTREDALMEGLAHLRGMRQT